MTVGKNNPRLLLPVGVSCDHTSIICIMVIIVDPYDTLINHSDVPLLNYKLYFILMSATVYQISHHIKKHLLYTFSLLTPIVYHRYDKYMHSL